MKFRTLSCFTAIALFAALSPIQTAGQNNDKHPKHHHYKLIDLGTLGGSNSVITNPLSSNINRRGTVLVEAETTTHDPYDPNCFMPDCVLQHALQWKPGFTSDLGALDGVNNSSPSWINGHGVAAGYSENGMIDPLTGFPETRGVIWDDGGIRDLGTLGGNVSFANSVNDRGQVVGAALNTIADPFADSFLPFAFVFAVSTQSHAFVWDEGKGMQDLGTLGSGSDSMALVINEGGQVTGVSYTSSNPNSNNGPQCVPNVPTQDPFLWEKGKGMIDLGSLGGDCGWPYAMNNYGEVVGDSTPPGDLYMHPFLWTKATGMQPLPLVGGNLGQAYSINDAGQVVGWSSTKGDMGAHAMLWDRRRNRDLGTVGSDSCAIAFSINPRGQVVGFSGGASCTGHAFFWEKSGPLIDLNSLVPPKSPLHMYEAISINERGEIVGNGSLQNGDHHAFLLIPCDENHPGVEGCDYSKVETSAMPSAAPAPREASGRVPSAALWRRSNRFQFPVIGPKN